MQITRYIIQIIDTFENNRVLAEERTEAGAPKLQYNGSDDKYPPIITSELSFNFSVPGAADGKFFHLFTGNDTRYFVRLLNGDDNSVLWTGFLMPDQYGEPYKAGHLFVKMNATDGVGRIKGKKLAWEYYNKESSVIKLIAECLKLTGLSQVINFSPAILPAAVDYRWDEIYVDGHAYRDDEEEALTYSLSTVPSKFPKRKNAYEILELLLKSIGCTLYNWKNEWHIVGINRKHETAYQAYRYTPNGVFDGMVNKTRTVSRIVFEATPDVRVIPPWKRVNLSWGIDENGKLLPEDIITEAAGKWDISTGNPFIDSGNHGLPNEAPLKYWQGVGTIGMSVASSEGKFLVDWSVVGSIPIPVPQGPYNFYVARSVPETTAGTNFNYVQLRFPKYLKKSDEYTVRRLKFSVAIFGAGGSEEIVEQGISQDLYRCEIVAGTTVVVSNRPGGVGYANFKYDQDFRAGSMEVIEENPSAQNIFVTTSRQLTGELEKEEITLPNNGFLNVRFFLPVSPNPAEPILKGYTFSKFELEYTAQDEWNESLVRNIDYTTTYDLDYFHGDSIQDLTLKQFRFRRFIPIDDTTVLIHVLSSQYVPGGGFAGSLARFEFIISYQQAQLILQNPAALSITVAGVSHTINSLYDAPYTFGGIYNGSNAYGVLWQVQEAGGVYKLLIVEGTNPLFASIANFANMFIAEAGVPVQNGWVTENNEWRESWKRYGYDENRRHGVCLGRIYHDVQAEPLVSFEGDLFGLYGPDEILRKRWVDDRFYIPLRFTMDLSKGKTTGVVLMESKISNVNDYVAE